MEALLHSRVRFQAFGASHFWVLTVSMLLALVLIAWGRRDRHNPAHRHVTRLLGLVIVISEIVFVMYPVYLGRFGWDWGLPLQLCDLTALIGGLGLVMDVPFAIEVGFFLGLSATLITTATPDLDHDFPHIEFWCFFLTHSLVSAAMAYQAFGLDRRPRPGAPLRVWLAVNVYGLIASAINLRLDSNYLYICHKPGVSSPFDYLGPWPWYVVALDLILAGFIAVLARIARIVPTLPARSGGDSGHEL